MTSHIRRSISPCQTASPTASSAPSPPVVLSPPAAEITRRNTHQISILRRRRPWSPFPDCWKTRGIQPDSVASAPPSISRSMRRLDRNSSRGFSRYILFPLSRFRCATPATVRRWIAYLQLSVKLIENGGGAVLELYLLCAGVRRWNSYSLCIGGLTLTEDLCRCIDITVFSR